MTRSIKYFSLPILFLLLLSSCSTDRANIEIVQQFINSPNDQLEPFLSEDFQLNMIDEREFPKGESSISILTGYFQTRDLTGTIYENLKIETTSANEVRATYQLQSWLIDCIHLDSNFEDIFSIKNDKIYYLTTKATSSNSDSISKAEQKNFHNWIDQQNLSDSITETENWLKYMKVYCDSGR